MRLQAKRMRALDDDGQNGGKTDNWRETRCKNVTTKICGRFGLFMNSRPKNEYKMSTKSTLFAVKFLLSRSGAAASLL